MNRFLKKMLAFLLVLSVLPAAVSCRSVTSDTPTAPAVQKTKFSRVFYEYFDTMATIVGYEETQEAFDEKCEYIRSELERYNKLYDIYHKYSDVTNIYVLNRDGGTAPVAVDDDIIALLKFGMDVYEKTSGMTNIAMGSVLSIWHDYRTSGADDPVLAELPPVEDLVEASAHCNIDDIVIDEANKTVSLADPFLKIDVGAIAKGYATERIAQDLIAMGAENYALNIGGNVRTIGPKGDGNPWVAGIQNPDLHSDNTYLRLIELDSKTLVTSGSYQRYYYVDGVRYHHIIHPQTLMPNDTFASVSILTNDSGWADALSTACFNLSLEEGLDLIESLPDTEAMWVEADGTEHFSEHFLDYEQLQS